MNLMDLRVVNDPDGYKAREVREAIRATHERSQILEAVAGKYDREKFLVQVDKVAELFAEGLEAKQL